VTEEKFVAPHDVRDIVEGRGVEFHDTVPSGRLVNALVQWLELSPELYQRTAARACIACILPDAVTMFLGKF